MMCVPASLACRGVRRRAAALAPRRHDFVDPEDDRSKAARRQRSRALLLMGLPLVPAVMAAILAD
jgi:hypothetical protein